MKIEGENEKDGRKKGENYNNKTVIKGLKIEPFLSYKL